MAKASSAEGKVSRRRRAPAESGLPADHAGPGRLGHDHRLEAVEGPERPGPGLLGQQDGGASARVAEPVGVVEAEVVDDGQHVGGEPGPGEVAVGRPVGSAVGPEVQAPAVVVPGQVRGQRAEDLGAEAGGVDQQQVRPLRRRSRRRRCRAVGCGAPIAVSGVEGRARPVVTDGDGSRTPVGGSGPRRMPAAGMPRADPDRLDIGGLWSIFSRPGATWPSSS